MAESQQNSFGQIDQGPARPQLVIGLAAAVGTPLEYFIGLLEKELNRRGYKTTIAHLSRYTQLFELDSPYPSRDADAFTRIWALMDLGNKAREKSGIGSILAMCAVHEISGLRQSEDDLHVARAFILRQLKHPEEVHLLRQVYEDGFHLVGLYSSLKDRKHQLRKPLGIDKGKVEKLIDRDEHEPSRWGQHLRDTFHLSDIFLDLGQSDETIRRELSRWLDLLFGMKICSPSRDEFGMFQAKAASLRSAQLSRQVGAAIMSKTGDLIAIGTNEVPCYGGGQYWDGMANDARDHVQGVDSNDRMKGRILKEILSVIDPEWRDLTERKREARLREARASFAKTRIMHLTEFGRAVHAEMEAILAAARIGVSPKDAILYSTTFPCHNCTKHIVGAGIRDVVYVEPYPKSLGPDLHGDAVSVDEKIEGKVTFRPFVGIAPRRYLELFSMTKKDGREIERKDEQGKLITDSFSLKLRMPHRSCVERENDCVEQLEKITRKKS